MQHGSLPLHGFERDINSLIDAFALQAELEQTLSFITFKHLFKAGGYAYLHQAYLGCEHSPEYTQLLYATALDRLDILSPTAAPSSALWLMHVDKAAGAAAGAAAAPQAAVRSQRQWSLAGVEQTALAAAAASSAADKAAGTAAAAAVTGVAAAPAAALEQQQQCTMQHASSVKSMALNSELLPGGSLAGGSTVEQQEQQQCGLQSQQQQQQQPTPALQLQPLGVPLPPLQQQQQQQAPALQLQPLAAPQLQQQPLPLLGPQHLLDPSDGMQQQQQQTGAADQEALPRPPPAVAGSDAADPLASLASIEDELDDDFFNDLLAIFDEAEGLQPNAALDTQTAAPAALTAGAAAAACDSGVQPAATPAAAAAQDQQASAAKQQSQPQQQQQRPAMSVPLAVKAGVVFMLHCLHETQLNLPPVAVYTSLQHLQLLQQAAAQFAAAGAAGADALGVLQLLLKQQRLLVGQFRRPVHWVPQLPASLAPAEPRYPDLGVGLAAANRAAARAHNGARVAAVHAAANAARSLRANPRSVDPVVHREALFHIKTALRSLANFRSLQVLCSKYADARQAIFEPLLRIKEPAVAVAQQQQQQQQAQEQQQQEQPGCKRGASGKLDNNSSSSKRSKSQSGKQAVDRSQKCLQLLQEQQQQQQRLEEQQRQATAAAEAARAAGIPELFDRSFAANLSQLAGNEAAQMLVLLDPGKNPAYVRQMLNKQQQALEESEAAGTSAAGRESNARLQALAGGSQRQQQQHRQQGKAGNSRQGARGAGGAGAAEMLRQQQQQGWQYLQELVAAGVLHPAELQELQEEDESEGSVQGFGAAGQVLQLQRQRRQHTLVLAEQWFRSHDALMMQAADHDEDMP